MSTFSVANDDTLVAAIQRCRTRLAYIAPGITKPVASALGELYARPVPPQVTVILDADPEVYRLGYGTVEGLTRLRELAGRYQFGMRAQPGLRVGVLASDDDLIVYAPTPLLIEAGSTTEQKPNAICLGAAPLQQVLNAAAAEGAPEQGLPADAEVGEHALGVSEMDNTMLDLERMPPKQYDVARVERVFSSALQYVELEIRDYKLSTRRVSIPNDLLIGENRELEQRLRNTYALLEGHIGIEIPALDPETHQAAKDDKGQVRKIPYTEESIHAERRKLEQKYLVNISGHGWLIKRADRPRFDHDVELLRHNLSNYGQALAEAMESLVKKSTQELARRLYTQMQGQLPGRLEKLLISAQPTEAGKLDVLESELAHAFNQTRSAISSRADVRYKDLTYETIKNKDFREKVARAYRIKDSGTGLAALFDEYDAAREVEQPDLWEREQNP